MLEVSVLESYIPASNEPAAETKFALLFECFKVTGVNFTTAALHTNVAPHRLRIRKLRNNLPLPGGSFVSTICRGKSAVKYGNGSTAGSLVRDDLLAFEPIVYQYSVVCRVGVTDSTRVLLLKDLAFLYAFQNNILQYVGLPPDFNLLPNLLYALIM
mmetsp:Transcript_452/g.712  ORF Transcript_452/g.712 Transcript_452/m.712 type:complete len:157 (+) Transcript_452:7705-8175(+)